MKISNITDQQMTAIVIAYLALIFLSSGTLMFFVGARYAQDQTMQQAFEQGRAVQCLGRAGYHWRCDNE